MSQELSRMFFEVCGKIESHNAMDTVVKVTARKSRHETVVNREGKANFPGEEVVIVHLLEDGVTVRNVKEDTPALSSELVSDLEGLSTEWKFYDIDEGRTGSVELACDVEIPIGEDKGEILQKQY
jgi:hypothetical protein